MPGRDVFKVEADTNTTRFGAKFLGTDGWGEKWSGAIPEIWELNNGHLSGPIITNSEGKGYKVNRISYENPEGEEFDVNDDVSKNHFRKYFWIEALQ